MFTLRHGDVIIEQVDTVPAGCKLLPRHIHGLVLAEGEVTGHAHRIQAEPGFAELWGLPNQPTNDNGTRFLVVDRVVMLAHEEHKTMTIPPGTYRVRVKRQYSPSGWEQVQD